MQPGEPLRYPAHFPPSTRLKRFFIGVRWLGPDLSFLKDLRANQASRCAASMEVWGSGNRKAVAAAAGAAFAKYCHWPQPYFLPSDNVAVIAGGHKFGGFDTTDVRDAIGAIEEMAGTQMGPTFWEASGTGTFGELIDKLIVAAGPNHSFEADGYAAAQLKR
jgi:hypothetical protein